jgi:hypothetical protein
MSFQMPHWNKSFQDTMAMLAEKTMRKPRPAREDIFWSGLAGGFFAVVLGGGLLEFLAAFLGSLFSMAFVKALSPFRPSNFWATTMAGAIICLTVVPVPENLSGYGHGAGHCGRCHALAARYGFYQWNP